MLKNSFRATSLSLLIASALVITACQNSSLTEQSPEPTIPADRPEDSTVDFWYPSSIRDYIEGTAKPAFESKFPQYQLSATSFETNEAVWTNYQNAYQEDKAPDVAAIYEVALQQARDSGYFQSVSEATGSQTDINGVPTALDDISPSVESFYADSEGRYFSVPMSVSAPVFFTNMDLLQRAGIASSAEDTDAIPQNWDELRAACAAIRTRTEAKCAWWLQDSWFLENALAQADAPLVDQDNDRGGPATRSLVNSPPAVQYLTWWQ